MNSNAPNVLAHKQSIVQGDPGAIEAQHNAGKMTARERIGQLIDEGTFIEMDVFLKGRQDLFGMDTDIYAEGVVAGFGTIDGRPVYIYSQDFTALSGSIGEMNAGKICKAMDMAAKNGVPVIGILDSAGARLREGVGSLNGYAAIFNKASQLSGVVPQISLICGPCIGASAIAASMSDITLSVEGIGQIGAYGSYVYDASAKKENASGICTSKYAFEKSNLVNLLYKNEKECLNSLKKLLGYLPSSNSDEAPSVACKDDLNRNIPEFDNIMASSNYDVRIVASLISDNSEMYELSAGFAPNIITSFIKLNGRTVGVVANQPTVGEGTLDLPAANKAASFISFCDAFNIPVLTLVDSTGIAVSPEQEEAGLVKAIGRLAATYSSSSVPMVTMILNNAIGSAYAVMGSKALGVDMVYAWASAEVSPVGSDTATVILYDEEVKNAADPKKAKEEAVAKYRDEFANPIIAAEHGFIDDIIDPINTRPILVAAFEMLASKSVELPFKKHDSMGF